MSKDYMAEYHRWLDAGACKPIDDEKEKIQNCIRGDCKKVCGHLKNLLC